MPLHVPSEASFKHVTWPMSNTCVKEGFYTSREAPEEVRALAP